MSATHPEEPSASLYVREQIARIDLMHQRIVRMQNEEGPRIAALLAQAEKDRAATRRNWPAFVAGAGATLSGIGAILAALAATHVI